MSETKKILLISHEASLSGAPILVLSVLKKLRQERKNYKVDVLLLRPGQLYEDFAKLSDNKIIVANYYNQSLSFVNRNFKKIQNAFFPKTESKEEQIEKITGRLLQNNYDLVYANTAETLIWTIPFYKKTFLPLLQSMSLLLELKAHIHQILSKKTYQMFQQLLQGLML